MRIAFFAYCLLCVVRLFSADAEEKKEEKPTIVVEVKLGKEKTSEILLDGEIVSRDHLKQRLESKIANDVPNADGNIARPVRLILSDDAPMREIEHVVMVLASLRLVNPSHVVRDKTIDVFVGAAEDNPEIKVDGVSMKLDDFVKRATELLPDTTRRVRISYPETARWRHVMKISNLCKERGIPKSDFIPPTGPASITVELKISERAISSYLIDGDEVAPKDVIKHLQALVANVKLGPIGERDTPVTLNIPGDAPMREVERAAITIAGAKLINVKFASVDGSQVPDKIYGALGVADPETSLTLRLYDDGGKTLWRTADRKLPLEEGKKEVTNLLKNAKIKRVNISYDLTSTWKDVVEAFQLCVACKVSEFGLVPGGADRDR